MCCMSPVTNQICGPQAGVPSKPVFGLLGQRSPRLRRRIFWAVWVDSGMTAIPAIA
jgi:hypothetical protein